MSNSQPTPRQQQLLHYASTGLSDDEIATRLKLSPRVVRFEFEKIYQALGVRDRSAAIVAWRSEKRPRRPADECPFPRPFPDQFSACPAYTTRIFVTLDEGLHPTGNVWTCGHLESRSLGADRHGWYGACALGDASVRTQWADHAGPDRVRARNRVVEEIGDLSVVFAQRLWYLKQSQTRALRLKHDPGPATRWMRALEGWLVDDLETRLVRHSDWLEANQRAAEECLPWIRRLLDRIIDPASPGEWDDRFEALVRFPEDL